MAVQQIAAEISLNRFNTNTTSGNYKPTSTSAIAKVLGKNGVANAETYTAYRQDVLDGLKAGDKFVLVPNCYNQGGSNVSTHAVMVVKEVNGDYGVYDVLFNDGDKTIYSRAQFEKFLNGESAMGRTVSGITITKPVYLNSTSGTIRYVFGNDMYMIGDSSKIVGSYTRNKSNEYISIINGLLSRGDIPSLSRTWLEQAKVLSNNICKGNMSDNDKGLWFVHANKILDEVKEKNASISSIINATEGNYRGFTDYFDGFSSLEYILNTDEESKILIKYGEHGLYIIDKVSEYFNLSKNIVYEQFVKNRVTKDQMKTIDYTFSFLDKDYWYNKGNWAENLSNIPETFSQLLEMSFTKGKNSSYNQSINIINTFLNNKETGQLARTWLEQAKVLVSNTLNGSKSSYEKKVWFDNANSALKEVEKNKATSLSLTKATADFGVFSSLQSVLKNDITYKIYTEYEKNGFDAINQIAEYFNLNEATVYEQFIKNGIKKSEMKVYILPKLQKTPLSDPSWYDKKSWTSNYLFIPETFSILLQMVPVKDKDKMYNQCIDTINTILKKEGLSKMAKTWLEKAKVLVKNKLNSKKSDLEKYDWFNKANKMLQEIEKSNDIMSTIATASVGTYKGTIDYFDGFKPLKEYIMDYLKSKILAKPISFDLGSSLDLPNKFSACIKIADNLLYDDNISQEAKKWLEETKNLMMEVFNSEKTTDEKKAWFDNTYSILNGIKKNKASISYINTINLAA